MQLFKLCVTTPRMGTMRFGETRKGLGVCRKLVRSLLSLSVFSLIPLPSLHGMSDFLE